MESLREHFEAETKRLKGELAVRKEQRRILRNQQLARLKRMAKFFARQAEHRWMDDDSIKLIIELSKTMPVDQVAAKFDTDRVTVLYILVQNEKAKK